MAATMAGVSAAGTALLMPHILRQLKRMEKPEKSPARNLMATFWGLALAGVVVKWAVYKGAGCRNGMDDSRRAGISASAGGLSLRRFFSPSCC